MDMSLFRKILRKIEQATRPVNPELRYGDQDTVKANDLVREQAATPIKIITD
jgi:hypothetical protein